MTKKVKFTVELSEEEALAYAQHLKRSGFSDYKCSATSEQEAYLMRDAAGVIQRELANSGFAPR